MAKKKRDSTKKDEEAALPKFGGFQPLAGGLAGLKAQLDTEAKAAAERQKAAGGKAPPLAKPSPPARREPEPARARAPSGDRDDELSFHRMMAGVTPLEATGKARVPLHAEAELAGDSRQRAAAIKARAATEAEQALAHLRSIVDETARFEVSDDGRRVEGRRLDVSPDLLRTLRRGMLPVDGRLDLHGMTASEARDKLAEFLGSMRARNERCVLVIHGKGERVPGAGVLRGEMAAWLSQGKGREHVAAFATARTEDGGEGAVYVALRV